MDKQAKSLVKLAFAYGVQGFEKYNSAPASNPEFMAIVPNCSFSDDAGCKLRVKMYKEYIKGWTTSHLKTIN